MKNATKLTRKVLTLLLTLCLVFGMNTSVLMANDDTGAEAGPEEAPETQTEPAAEQPDSVFEYDLYLMLVASDPDSGSMDLGAGLATADMTVWHYIYAPDSGDWDNIPNGETVGNWSMPQQAFSSTEGSLTVYDKLNQTEPVDLSLLQVGNTATITKVDESTFNASGTIVITLGENSRTITFDVTMDIADGQVVYSSDDSLYGYTLVHDLGEQNDTDTAKPKDVGEESPENTDKSSLQNAISRASRLTDSDYTEDSWAVLQSAINSGADVLAEDSIAQYKVDAASNNIGAAMDGLEAASNPVPEAPPELETGAGPAMDPTLETPPEEPDPALQTGPGPAEEPGPVEEPTPTPEPAPTPEPIPQPTSEVDKSKLEAALHKAIGFKKDTYTAESWKMVDDAMAQGQMVDSDMTATQEQVDQAVKTLTDAMDGLKTATVVANKSKLKEAINKAKELKKETYTADSWKVVETALAEADKIDGKKDATQDEVNKAEKDLENAMSGLKLVPGAANKSQLESEIKIANALIASDYTEKSWNEVETALTEAKKIDVEKEAKQDEVDKATKNLVASLTDLEKLQKGAVKSGTHESIKLTFAGAHGDIGSGSNVVTKSGGYVWWIVGGIAIIGAVVAVAIVSGNKRKNQHHHNEG